MRFSTLALRFVKRLNLFKTDCAVLFCVKTSSLGISKILCQYLASPATTVNVFTRSCFYSHTVAEREFGDGLL